MYSFSMKQPAASPKTPSLVRPPIVQKGDPVLRELAQPVPLKDITSPRIQKIIADMQVALAGEDDGVAIAAPQIGVPLRIFVVSGPTLHEALTSISEKEAAAAEKSPKKKTAKKSPKETATPPHEDIVFINPVITKLSRIKESMDEGCLSVRWLYGRVIRSAKATVRAYNERGEVFERGASGLLAQIFQHETDHLDGVLFSDKATNLEEVPPEKQ
jgi:peptide deformylase